MTARDAEVAAAATAMFIGGAIASLKPFPLWQQPGETPRELEAAVSWPSGEGVGGLYSGQGDGRKGKR